MMVRNSNRDEVAFSLMMRSIMIHTKRPILNVCVSNRIRFTVVSEPPEEEEQEKECEEVGMAFLRIPDILELQQDLTETSLNGEHTLTHTHAHRDLRVDSDSRC